MSDGTWIVVRLAFSALWLPEADADELFAAVHLAPACVVDGSDPAWETGALVPGGNWTGLQVRGGIRHERCMAFRPDRDVALVKLAGDGSVEDRLSRLGPVDEYLGELDDVPGLTTQTIRGEGGRRMGLHLDNWDRRSVAHRDGSRNRASVNLGKEPRWFMFVDHDVIGGHPRDEVPTTASARRALLASSGRGRAAIVRLKVLEDWAYVAPTENLLHDSWTVAQRHGTSHGTALGRFDPRRAARPADAFVAEADLTSVAEPDATPVTTVRR